mmetsp:Transcript_21297/g.49556  ORF Transcript_21297/g.49556 Transcript_21297/m.49556 type:complete len:259 (-) Transcript_21297:767-1543(-)
MLCFRYQHRHEDCDKEIMLQLTQMARCPGLQLAKLHLQLLHQSAQNRLMLSVHLLICQRPRHVAPGDAKHLGSTSCFGVSEIVHQVYLLDLVAALITDHFKEIIVRKIFGKPHTDVLENWRILGERFEPGLLCEGFRGELLRETWILRPEKPDVRDAEEDHGQALQPESEGPSMHLLRIQAGVPQHIVMNHPAAQNFHPVFLVEDFQLHGWLGERKVLVKPSHGVFSRLQLKQVRSQAFQGLFEIFHDFFLRNLLSIE